MIRVYDGVPNNTGGILKLNLLGLNTFDEQEKSVIALETFSR